MPIYEYVCARCGHAFEHLARRLNDAAGQCPRCGAARPRKVFSVFAARAPTAATRACDGCRTNPTCPSAGKGGCGCDV
jgi:putative FmdB family regulatory protein